MQIMIPASAGELVDKITILEIKKSRIKDKMKLRHINKELGLLKASLKEILKVNKKITSKITPLRKKLKAVNTSLWDIENVIRGLEAKKDFGSKFIQYARSVYITNDKRSEVKAEINKLFGLAALNEVKQYTGY